MNSPVQEPTSTVRSGAWLPALLGVVGFAVLAAVFRGFSDNDGVATTSEMFTRAAIGAALGAVLATALSFAPHPTFRRLRWLLIVIGLILGAVIGAASSPLREKVPDPPASDPPPIDLEVLPGVRIDHPDGSVSFGIDRNRDGVAETILVACDNVPAASFDDIPEPPDSRRGDYVPIDDGCDGTVDGWVLISDVVEVERQPPPIPQGSPQDNDGTSGLGAPDLGGLVKWLLLALLVAVVVIGGTYWYLERTDPGAAPLDDDSDDPDDETEGVVDTAAAVITIEDTIAAMLADPDPRTAIIGAYASLLAGLESAGVRRFAFEAPNEHLQRCLVAVQVEPSSLQRLVDLFGAARFSSRPITEDHRAEAIASLRYAQGVLAARSQLAASDPPPSAP